MKMMYARSNDDSATTPMHNVDFDDIVQVFKAIDSNAGWSFGVALYYAMHGAYPDSNQESWRRTGYNEVELTVSWNGQSRQKFICWLG